MSTYHIIGDADTVLGFRFAGVTGDVVTTTEEARQAFRAALDAGREPIGILLVTEKVESLIPEEIQAHRVSAQPPYMAVVQGVWEKGGRRQSLQDMINEAVGIHI